MNKEEFETQKRYEHQTQELSNIFDTYGVITYVALLDAIIAWAEREKQK